MYGAEIQIAEKQMQKELGGSEGHYDSSKYPWASKFQMGPAPPFIAVVLWGDLQTPDITPRDTALSSLFPPFYVFSSQSRTPEISEVLPKSLLSIYICAKARFSGPLSPAVLRVVSSFAWSKLHFFFLKLDLNWPFLLLATLYCHSHDAGLFRNILQISPDLSFRLLWYCPFCQDST